MTDLRGVGFGASGTGTATGWVTGVRAAELVHEVGNHTVEVLYTKDRALD